MLIPIIGFVCLGLTAGFPSGLLGIGGGIILVPAMIWSFQRLGFPTEIGPHLAVGTSLSTMLFTSLSSARTHHQHGSISWSPVFQLSLGILVGAAIGAQVASRLEGAQIQRYFAMFALFVGSRMLFKAVRQLHATPLNGRDISDSSVVVLPKLEVALAGLSIGGLSSLFGIGGGSLSVPYLSFRGHSMRRAVAISSACGFPIALSGTLTNIWTGWEHAQTPSGALGFVYLPATLGISLGTVIGARQGAKLVHRFPQAKLRLAFALLLLIVAAKMAFL